VFLARRGPDQPMEVAMSTSSNRCLWAILLIPALYAFTPSSARADTPRPARQLALAAESRARVAPTLESVAPAARLQTQTCDRKELATFVRKQVQAWAPAGAKVTVKPWCFVESQSEASRPITGHGAQAFQVKLDRKSGAKRSAFFKCWLAGKSKMKVLAGKNSQGQMEIFGYKGLTLPARVGRPFGAGKRMAVDLVLDEKARNAILAGAAGALAAPVTKGVSLALVGYTVSEVGKSLNNGRRAQKDSLGATGAWVADRARTDGVYPTFDAAYRHYCMELEDRTLQADGNLVGAAPWARTKFYDRLRDLGF
jgi:hypothetical protein